MESTAVDGRSGGESLLVTEVLAAAREQLQMDLAFLSRLTPDEQIVIDIDGDPDPFTLPPGTRVDAANTYCARLVRGEIPNLIPDAATQPHVADLPATREGIIGAYVGVPVHTEDGRLYGTLCCVSSSSAQGLSQRDVQFLKVLAELLGRVVHGESQDATQKKSAARIRTFIDAQQIRTVYQPIVDLRSGKVAGVEALSRFPDGVSPEFWFSEAVRVGMGMDLECATFASALASLPQLPADTYLSLNASPEFIASEEFASRIHTAPVDRVVIELTEHAAVESYALIAGALEQERGSGLRLAVDDAGAGFASFRHILSLSPDIIKLDISLTREVVTDPVQHAFAATVSSFAERIGARLVAEGVETQPAATTLTSLGVSHAQGYYFSKPAALPLERLGYALAYA